MGSALPKILPCHRLAQYTVQPRRFPKIACSTREMVGSRAASQLLFSLPSAEKPDGNAGCDVWFDALSDIDF